MPPNPSSTTTQPLHRYHITPPQHPALTREQTQQNKASKSLPTADPSNKTQQPLEQVVLEEVSVVLCLFGWVCRCYCSTELARCLPYNILTPQRDDEALGLSMLQSSVAHKGWCCMQSSRGIQRRVTDPAQLEEDQVAPRWLFPVPQAVTLTMITATTTAAIPIR